MPSWKPPFEPGATTGHPAIGEVRDVSDQSQESVDPPAVVDRFSWLLEQARSGNKEVLHELRETLDGRPDLWRHFGDLGGHAQAAWLAVVAGEDFFLKEAICRKLDEIRRELGIAQASALERLLIDRIALNWLRTHHAEIAASRATTNSSSLRVLEFWVKRLGDAERRYLASIGSLATLRRLLPSAPVQESPSSEAALPAARWRSETAESDLPPLRVVGQES
jgi:hypothetical protein